MKPNSAAQTALDRLALRFAAAKDIHEVVVGVHDGSSSRTLAAAHGDWRGAPVGLDTPFFIASTSKLLATAMIMRLRADGLLRLDDAIVRFFPAGEIDGLHRFGGRDHTHQITVRHLLAHSSGLPDYFEGLRRDGTRFADGLLAGCDGGYGLQEVIAWSRDEMRPQFPPGHGRRALYSDTNFYLLGAIIERVHGAPLPEALRMLVSGPLGLQATRFYAAGDEAVPLRHAGKELVLPLAMASMRVDGGAVSTIRDLLVFTRAFFAGRIFPAAYPTEMSDWRRIFFPLETGIGILRFRLPRWLAPFNRAPDLIGHSGILGAFAFHAPERDVTVCGTVNQLASRSRPYRLMVEALEAVRRSC